MEALGIEPKIILANIISFLLFLFVMSKYVYPLFLKWMDKEAKQLLEAKENYEKSKEEREAISKEREKLLQQAKKDINQLLVDSKNESRDILRQAEESASKKAEEIKEKAQRDLALQKEEIVNEAKKQSLEAAVKIVTKVMQDAGEKNAHDLVANAIKEI